MGLFPARKPVVNVIPETMDVSSSLQQNGIKAVDDNFNSQVKVNGKNLITTPVNQSVTIQIPGNQNQILALAKGSIVNSLTWWALFWLRVIKKAFYFGWKVVFKNDS